MYCICIKYLIHISTEIILINILHHDYIVRHGSEAAALLLRVGLRLGD